MKKLILNITFIAITIICLYRLSKAEKVPEIAKAGTELIAASIVLGCSLLIRESQEVNVNIDMYDGGDGPDDDEPYGEGDEWKKLLK